MHEFWQDVSSQLLEQVCVLRAHNGAGYTFGALAILVVLPPGKKPSRAQLCARSMPVTAIRLPPGSTASAQGDVGDICEPKRILFLFGGEPCQRLLNTPRRD